MPDRKAVSLHDLSYRPVLPQLRAEAPGRTEEFDLRGERALVAVELAEEAIEETVAVLAGG